ncbi:MAG TPA: hypothetical protein VFZ66_22075 [Herpetosiphonaceae bacterium]
MGVLERIRLAIPGRWRILRRGDEHQPGARPRPSGRREGNYQAYLIRFWRTSATMPWRAAVVDPRQDATHYFASREALYAFLDDQIDQSEAGS